jgi:hypothetical protein
MIAYEVPTDVTNDYMRIGESTALQCVGTLKIGYPAYKL